MRQVEVGGRKMLYYEGKLQVGLVLVHEIMGRDAYARSVAEGLSKEGFHVVAVDLYEEKLPQDLSAARSIRDSLNEDEVRRTMEDAWHLLRESYGSASFTGTIGFCMGGGIALKSACELAFDFCIDYYGMMDDVEKVSGLRGPLTLFLGTEDERVTPWAFDSLLPALRRQRKRVEMHLFPNAGHAFHRPGWKGHNEAAAREAWSRTLEVLRAFSAGVKGLEEKA